MTNRPKTVLLLTQVYVPDPASVGQHMADVAAELARRGHPVLVLCSNRGYEDPSTVYTRREVIDGVQVRRLPLSSFGKRGLAIRALAGLLFVFQCIVHGLFTRRLGCVLVTTVPPMGSLAAVVISFLRRVPIKYWVMDINPDQAIALGRIGASSATARALDRLNRAILSRSADVVTLDRFMAQRLIAKVDIGPRLKVLPPWPHEDHLEVVDHRDNPFRLQHGLQGKFVIMYSGNHTPSNPVRTVLQAARRLQDEPNLVFMFIGGGADKRQIEEEIARGATNIRSLPYQPLGELKYSLSAADVHLVTMGDNVVGIVHPCKVYGAMSVARPILFVGPSPSHAADLIDRHQIGWHVAHGDVEGAIAVIRQIMAQSPDQLAAIGHRAQQVIEDSLGKHRLCPEFCVVLERGLDHAVRAA